MQKTLNGTETVPYTLYERVEHENDIMHWQLGMLNIQYAENPRRKAINIAYLYKELTDEMFKRNISSDTIAIIHTIVARWQNG